MSTSFTRTIEALRIDRFGGSMLVLLVAVTLSGVWLLWFGLTGITHEVSASARLEIDQETHSIQSPVLARVESSHLAPEGVRATRISPDGKSFLIAGKGEIEVSPIGAGDKTRLCDLQLSESIVRWSLDGRYVFLRQTDRRSIRISRVDVATRSQGTVARVEGA